jgi:hypothetical protein
MPTAVHSAVKIILAADTVGTLQHNHSMAVSIASIKRTMGLVLLLLLLLLLLRLKHLPWPAVLGRAHPHQLGCHPASSG